MKGATNMNVLHEEHDNGIKEYTLTNNNGMTVKAINIGCSITEILVPDNKGDFSNVVLRYDTLEEYFRNEDFLGAVIAPIAGRVRDAEFEIGDESYSFTPNEGRNLLHSGELNPYNEIWESSIEEDKIVFQYKMDKRFPGDPLIKVMYSLNDENELKLEYEISAESKSIVAPTNHTYFNLSNVLEGDAGGHLVRSNTRSFLKVDEDLLPESVAVCEGVFDLKHGRLLKDVFESDDGQVGIAGGGFDHYFIFEKDEKEVEITEKGSGRTLKVTTTSPGMVLYTGNNLDGHVVLKDRKAQKHAGFCMETQESPAALKLPLDQDMRVEEEETYKRETVFRFGVEK